MANKIPNSVIGAVASVLGAYYFSHSKLNALFLEAGAPGEETEGNCEKKCIAWLRRCNEDDSVDALAVLGGVLQPYMDLPGHPGVADGQQGIRDSLAKSQLTYQTNGYVSLAGANVATRTLADYLRAGDYASVDAEFGRAIAQLDRDPHAAVTAASSIVEAICKTCLETLGVELPAQHTEVVEFHRVMAAPLSQNKSLTELLATRAPWDRRGRWKRHQRSRLSGSRVRRPRGGTLLLPSPFGASSWRQPKSD